MFIDARGLENNTVVETVVCIIGAGAAGITLAVSLRTGGFPVVLLESGGFEYDQATQQLDVGILAGVPNVPTEVSRARYFGGTTNLWAGTCRPFDPVDFEPRAGIPLSGWPLRLNDLRPYYDQAQHYCELGPPNYDLSSWPKQTGTEVPRLDPTRLKGAIFQISPPTRFGKTYREELRRSDTVTVYLNANAVDLRANATASSVESVKVATLGGPGFSVRARYVVLATGGLENARILLMSNDVQSAGLGNTHDQVGRYFMDHPYFPWAAIARFVTPNPSLPYIPQPLESHVFLTLVAGDAPAEPKSADTDGIAGFQILLGGLHRVVKGVDSLKTVASALSHFSVPADFWEHLGNIWRDSDAVMDTLYRTATGSRSSPFAETEAAGAPVTGAAMDILLEQVPNPDSRVMLSHERDALGQPRLILDWRMTEIERRTYQRAQELVALEFGRLGIGRVKGKPLPDDGWPSSLLGANHHVGTTRMAEDPKLGVVDVNCRVHGVSNLYVSSSSAFPTSGYANPTLTIVAMALRLGDELRRLMA